MFQVLLLIIAAIGTLGMGAVSYKFKYQPKSIWVHAAFVFCFVLILISIMSMN